MGGVINQRWHRGLQELSSLAETGRTLLGPVKASKFIVGEGSQDGELVQSVRRLLGALDLGSAVGQLLWEAVEAQHSAHHVGTGTLLFLVGAWSRAAQECLQLGVPGPVLVAAMSEGLSACLREVSVLQVPLHGVSSSSPLALSTPRAAPGMWGPFLLDESCDADAASQPGPPAPRLPERLGAHATLRAQVGGLLAETRLRKPALTHSRHFARTLGRPGAPQPLPGVGPRVAHLLTPCCEGPADLAELEAGLSHGDPGSMELVRAVARWQGRGILGQPGSSPASVLDLATVFTCCLPGFPESSSVCAGFVMVLPSSWVALVAALQAQPIRLVLLEGDLTESYRHPGFRGPAGPSTVQASLERPRASSEELWLDRVLRVLAMFRVNLVLAQGCVSEALLERCMSSGCLALGSVSGRALRALAKASGAVPLAYVTQLEECSVGIGMRVAFGESTPWEAVERMGRVAITLQAEASPLTTVVLASPVAAELQAREDRFWACAHRLSQALQDGWVFLGGGATELLCLCHLHVLAGTAPGEQDQACPPRHPAAASWMDSALALYRPTVLQCLARGWHRYLCALSVNSAVHSTELDASSCIQQHVQQAVGSGSPATFIARKYGRLGCGALSEGPAVWPGQAPKVYDVITPKVEAWRRALDLVMLVLQTDCEVITGLGPTQISSQESKDLLFL